MNDSGFTGLEAAIVLIAFVVVAAVFSYVVLGAGFFATQKTQETVYKGIGQATSNLQIVGNVYGLSATPTNGIDEIRFTLSLAPGASSLNLQNLKVIFSTPTGDIKTFSKDGTNKLEMPDAIAQGDQAEFSMGNTTSPLKIESNTKITIEIRPESGATLPFTKTAPAILTNVNILY